jgi:hypothetical protein
VAKYSRDKTLEYRASIIPIRQKSQEEIDKQVLTISSAALGLSLTFYKDVLAKQIVIHGWILLAAWVFWIVAIGSVVFSMYLSSEVVRKRVKSIDEALEKATEEDEVELDLSGPGAGMLRLLRFTNLVNLATFFAGILSFALVLLLNISLGPHN